MTGIGRRSRHPVQYLALKEVNAEARRVGGAVAIGCGTGFEKSTDAMSAEFTKNKLLHNYSELSYTVVLES
jgi:hypothetical protein